MELYLQPTYFIDAGHRAIIRKAEALTEGLTDTVEITTALFYYVRDNFRYSPYHVSFEHAVMKASYILSRPGPPQAYCIEKAVLFAALCRAKGIPNRLVFCNVRNHIATERLEKAIGTDLMVFHGYNEVFVNDCWVKCTVAFNKALCTKLGVAALEFDGYTDQIFQAYDREGGQFMEYVHDYGIFHDVPHDLWKRETRKYYPHLFAGEAGKEYLTAGLDAGRNGETLM